MELRGDDITGLGVVIARRVCDLAVADELLASRTVKDLVIGSESASWTVACTLSRAFRTTGSCRGLRLAAVVEGLNF